MWRPALNLGAGLSIPYSRKGSEQRRNRITIQPSKAIRHRGWVIQVNTAWPAALGDVCAKIHLGLDGSAGIQRVCDLQQGQFGDANASCVCHKSITSCSGTRPVTDAARIRWLDCPGRRDVALRIEVVMGLSFRIDDESRTILREWAAGLLNSLQARLPCCSRKMLWNPNRY